LEDQFGTIEFHVASAKLNDYRDVLTSGEPLLITGTVDAPFGEGESALERLRFMDAKPLASIRAERSNLMEIRLNVDLVSDEQMTTLHKLLRQFPGPCHTRLRLEIPQRNETVLDLGDDFKVAAADYCRTMLAESEGSTTIGTPTASPMQSRPTPHGAYDGVVGRPTSASKPPPVG
jgi:DNA polymerase III alpha subunit